VLQGKCVDYCSSSTVISYLAKASSRNMLVPTTMIVRAPCYAVYLLKPALPLQQLCRMYG
jgi:hypothetical protein